MNSTNTSLKTDGKAGTYFNFGNEYLIVHKTKNASDAQEYCSDKGMNLATIDSAEENDFLQGSNLWIGLERDCTDPEKWRWGQDGDAWAVHSDQDGIYRNWARGQPRHILDNPLRENCVRMIAGEWHDYPCDVKSWFVCKKKHV